MKALRAILVAVLLSVPPAMAQENAPMVQKPAAPAQDGSKGTAPEGQGSTGWTGGTGGSFIGTQHQGSSSSPNEQPAVASGADLKGPPVQNAPGKTPE